MFVDGYAFCRRRRRQTEGLLVAARL